MLHPIDIERLAKAMGEPVEHYTMREPKITPRSSGRAAWFAFMRGLGYGLARFVWRGISR